MAPRFKFQQYSINQWCKSEKAYPETMRLKDFLRVRWENYELLYNLTILPEDWWGWIFLERSHVREKR